MVKSIKKVKKNKKRMNKILYLIVGLVIGIFIFTAGTMAMMVKDEIKEEEPGPPPEPEKEPHLLVEDVFFMKVGVRSDDDGSEKVDVLTTVYVTNDGLADGKQVKITARPIDEDKNQVLDKTDKIAGTIPIQKTSEIELTISVPRGGKHTVDLMIFERGKLILRGSGSVVIEGSSTNTPKYETRDVLGTVNDTDYDGLPDDWERYYGLDPSDPNDAYEDPDRDGVVNLEEYRGNTEPRDPRKASGGAVSEDKDDESGLNNSGAIGGLAIFIAIIIIIAIILAVFASSKHEHTNKVNTNSQAYTNQYASPNAFNAQPGQSPNVPKRCSRCGGWVMNDTCTLCGSRFPPITAPVVPQPQVVKEPEEADDAKEEDAEWKSEQK